MKLNQKNILKSASFLALFVFVILFTTGCANTDKPMTLEEEAAHYGLTVEELKAEKQAAARMNMSWEEHAKMLEGEHMMNEGEMGEMGSK